MPDAKNAGVTRKVEPDLSLRFRQNQYPWAFDRGAGINKNAGVEMYFQGSTHMGREERTPPWRALVRLLASLPVSHPQPITTKWKPFHIRLQLSCESLHSAQHRAHFNADTACCHHWIALTFTKSFSGGTWAFACGSVCAILFVFVRHQVCMCQSATYQQWATLKRCLLRLFSSDSLEAVEHLWT